MRNLKLICLVLALAGCAGSASNSVQNDMPPQRGVSSAVAGDQATAPRPGSSPPGPVPGTPPRI